MARIRTIKPEFFTSEQIVECSTSARLLFVGMWCFSDDQGVHPASIKRLKMEVFPSDPFTDDDLQQMVQELLHVGLLCEFEAEHQRFWAVTGWKKHQKIDRPTNKYPAPPELEFDEYSSNTRRGLDEDSTTARPRKGMESKGRERSLREGKEGGASDVGSGELTAVTDAWNTIPDAIPVRELTSKRITALKARLKVPTWKASWRQGIEKIIASAFCRGANDRAWKADFDWFIRPDTLTKILEGKYDDRPVPLQNGHSNGSTDLFAGLRASREGRLSNDG